MFKEWFNGLGNDFDPSVQELVGSEDFVRILKGKVTNSNRRDSVYFVVCSNGLDMLQGDKAIRVDKLPNVVSAVFDKSEWFGKFRVKGHMRIIVPGQYDLSIDTKEKELFLEATERARYYGMGNLQLDKDSANRILRTDIGFEGLRELVNSSCSGYNHGGSLRAWDS